MSLEMSVLGTFTGKMGQWSMDSLTLKDVVRICKEYEKEGLQCDDEPSEPGDSEYAYLSKESDDEFWKGLQDYQVSGILGRKAFERWIEELGAFAEGCQTMGTLGGPLSGGEPSVVADVAFTMEEHCILQCIRATPVPTWTPKHGYRDHWWPRIEKAMWMHYGGHYAQEAAKRMKAL